MLEEDYSCRILIHGSVSVRELIKTRRQRGDDSKFLGNFFKVFVWINWGRRADIIAVESMENGSKGT